MNQKVIESETSYSELQSWYLLFSTTLPFKLEGNKFVKFAAKFLVYDRVVSRIVPDYQFLAARA